MSYTTDIENLNPDHYWTLNNTPNDFGDATPARPANQAVVNVSYSTIPIAEDTTHSRRLTSNASRFECADNNEMNLQIQAQRTMGGWVRLDSINDSIACIFKEGASVNNFAILLFPGNAIMCQALGSSSTPAINKQVFGNKRLAANRPYHICFRFGGPNDGAAFKFYIDGVEQTESVGDEPADDFPVHTGDVTWGDSDGDLRIGPISFQTVSVVNTRYSHWATWRTELDAQTQIREILFEKGAIPTHTIVDQAGLDALANTTLGDAPLSIRVDVAGNINLDASNIIFDENTSIHVQYTGTGTLNWSNLGTTNASIASTPNGGTVNFINTSSITLTGLQNNTEVRVYQVGTQTEIAGQENVTTGSFTFSTTETSVDIVVLSLDFQNLKIDSVNTSSDSTIPVQQIADRQYLNP